jgi:hypothetical protein
VSEVDCLTPVLRADKNETVWGFCSRIEVSATGWDGKPLEVEVSVPRAEFGLPFDLAEEVVVVDREPLSCRILAASAKKTGWSNQWRAEATVTRSTDEAASGSASAAALTYALPSPRGASATISNAASTPTTCRAGFFMAAKW